MSVVAVDEVVRGFADQVRDRLGTDIEMMLLFGSRARGEAGPGSDYDVAIVVRDRTSDIEDRVLDVVVHMLDQHQALISAHVFSAEEWNVERLGPFGLNVAREGISI